MATPETETRRPKKRLIANAFVMMCQLSSFLPVLGNPPMI